MQHHCSHTEILWYYCTFNQRLLHLLYYRKVLGNPSAPHCWHYSWTRTKCFKHYNCEKYSNASLPEGPSVRSVRGAGRDILGQATITNPSLIHFHPHHPFLLMKSVLWGNCLIFLTQKKHLLKLWSYNLIHYLFSQQLRQRVGFPRGFSQRLKLSFSFPAWTFLLVFMHGLNFPFGSLLGLNLEHGANHSSRSGLKRQVALVCGHITAYNAIVFCVSCVFTFVFLMCICIWSNKKRHILIYVCISISIKKKKKQIALVCGRITAYNTTAPLKMKSDSRSLHTIRHRNPI